MFSRNSLPIAIAAVLVFAGMSMAGALGPNDFRISDMGTNGLTEPTALIPFVAYNSVNHQFLVVWHGRNDDLVNEREIWGQRMDASSGAEIGTNDFRISDMGPDGNEAYTVSRLAVAYNATNNEYLVVWRGDDNTPPLVDDEFEIFGQRINAATGAEVGTNDFRISFMGTIEIDGVGDVPWVVWNSTNNEYLVTWRGHDGDGEFEIWGQRLAGATGAAAGGRIRISDAGVDGDDQRYALDAKSAYNSTNNEYLVVWQADDLATDNEIEIFGQRLNAATGAEIGTNDFRISDMGPDGDANYRGQGPAVAYNPVQNEYLVTFYGTDPSFSGAQVVGQRLSSVGSEIGTNDFLISDVGPQPGAGLYNTTYPSVAFDPNSQRYLVVWPSDNDTASSVDNEFEVWGQFLTMSGQHDGPNDFRISDSGPDGDPEFQAGDPDVAIAPNGVALIVWRGEDDIAPLVADEIEIFGQFYRFTTVEPDDDFNGDGNNDLFWRQPSTGKNVHWAMDGTTRLSYTSLLDVPGSAWTLAGTGHFNPGTDTHPDLLWRNSSTGQNVAWGMNGTTRISYASLLAVPNPWEVGGIDDFDADGDADIVWRNPSNGQNVLWTMDGTTRSSYASMLSVAGTEWKIGGVGDFDGDGKPDLVWRNYTTGQNVIWFMDGATRTSYASTLSTPTPAWRLQGVSDYDLDGKADLVWRNVTTGQNVIWFMDGASRTSYGTTLSVTDFSWEIQSPR